MRVVWQVPLGKRQLSVLTPPSGQGNARGGAKEPCPGLGNNLRSGNVAFGICIRENETEILKFTLLEWEILFYGVDLS